MSGTNASELLRSLGLLVDGPVVWGSPIRGRGPGVFIVELSGPFGQAPIDHDALRRWLERVPGLTLDGVKPAPRELAERLASFWLPTEPIVFVGRARRSISARVAAMYATPLGDARPYPAGHWLKALSKAAQMRIWWADTEAHEEYEDELLTQFAANLSEAAVSGLPDRSVVLPFANLARPTGETKAHGIEHALREPTDTPPSGPAGGTTTRPAAASARRPAAPRQPRRSVVRHKPGPPAPAPTYVSAAGITDLTAELDNLRNNVRPGVIERVKTARELGDLRENSDYEAARNEQSFVEGRIQALEALLRRAVTVEEGGEVDLVRVGSSVVVEIDGVEATWQIVGAGEADPTKGRISYASPIGQALLGRGAGEEVTAQLPRGELRVRLVEVR